MGSKSMGGLKNKKTSKAAKPWKFLSSLIKKIA